MSTLRRAGALVALTCLAAVLAGCGAAQAIRTQDVQDQIAAALATDVGGDFTVTCPSAIPAEEGYAFTCSVTDGADGAQVTVRVVEEDDQGAFSWQVVETSLP